MGSRAYTFQADKRVDLSGATVGQFTSPDSLITNPGSIGARAGDFGKIEQTITGNRFRIGMTGAEVKDLLVQVGETNRAGLNAVQDFAASSLNQVAAAQSGRTTDWQQFIPLIAIGLIAYAAVRRRSR
jgi:hypothetical protein